MKTQLKTICIGIVLTSFIFGGIAFGATALIQADYMPLQYFFNGQKKMPNEGEEGFIYNDRTYAPLRFIAEALDKDVQWDGENNIININDKAAEKPFYSDMNFYFTEDVYLYGVDSSGEKVQIKASDLKNYEAIKADISQYGDSNYRVWFVEIYKDRVIFKIGYMPRGDNKEGSYALYQYNLKNDTFHFIATYPYLLGPRFQIFDNKILIYYNGGVSLLVNLDTMEEFPINMRSFGYRSVIGENEIYYIDIDKEPGKNILYKKDLVLHDEVKIAELPIKGDLKIIGDWIYCADTESDKEPIVYKIKLDGTGLTKTTAEEMGLVAEN